MNEISFCPITSVPIDLGALLASAHHAQAGAVVLFSGEVRNHHEGREVLFLEYEAQEEMALSSIKAILKDAEEKWPLKVAVAQHRIGKVAISESAVVVVTAAAHRKEAYEASQYIIDRIKSETPIWKKEYFLDGENVWR